MLWLRLQAPNAGDLDLIPCQGTRSNKPQLRVQVLQLRLGEVKFKKKEEAFFCGPGSNTRSYTAFSWHISFISLHLEEFLSLSFSTDMFP